MDSPDTAQVTLPPSADEDPTLDIEPGVAARPPLIERRVFRILLLIAIAAVCVAGAINWVWSPAKETLVEAKSMGGGVLYEPEPLHLDKPALLMLPEVILSYETMARHSIPGQGNQAAEAIYMTLNMTVETQLPTNMYARVEGYASPDEAKRRADELAGGYPLERETFMINKVTPISMGYSPDRGSYAAIWSSGPYLTLVKASFSDPVSIPKQKQNFLRSLVKPVVEAVERYQRTGKQGVDQ